MTMPMTFLAADPVGNKPPTFWMPEQASTIAPSVDFTFMVITWISYFFLALVTVLLVWFAWRYRVRGEHAEAVDGPTHGTFIEVTWTVVPTIIVVAIFFMGFKGYLQMNTPPQNAYQIDVTAAKWLWNFKYPNGAQSDDLYIPAGQPVRLVMRSEDVLHSLYIRDFRVKKDVVPGRYNVLWFQADNPTPEGKFHWLFCTEYCGTDHSNMNRKVHVLPEADFALWLQEQGQWLDKIPEDELYSKAAPKLFPRCASCHSLDGSPGTGPSWGPSNGLPAIWERTEKGLTKVDGGKPLSDLIGPGKEYETPESYLRASILRPGAHIVDGYANAMPTFQGQLNDRAIDALIGMMKRLDEFDAKGNFKGLDPAKTAAR